MYKKIIFFFCMCFLSKAYSQEVTAVQKFPSSAAAGTDIIAEIVINKGTLTGFMKFFQEIPSGFTVTSIENKGGSFTFTDGGVKIVWISPPYDTSFTISYKISIPPGTAGAQTFHSKVSYVHNNESKRLELPPVTVSIGTGGAPVITKTESPKTEVPKSDPPVQELAKASPPKTEVPKAESPKPEVKKEVPAAPVSKPVPTAAAAGPGKTYKVQIGAFSAKPKIEGVPDISTLVLDNGITKYFTGNFSNYEDALKRRTEMVGKGFQGAFIVAFENGKIVK